MSDPAPNRRWFRFKLRTVFVVMTITCLSLGWLGWNVKIVKNRRAMLKWVEENKIPWTGSIASDPDVKLSWVRTLLGDELEVWPVQFWSGVDRAKLEEFQRVFPETDFWINDNPAEEGRWLKDDPAGELE